MTIRKRCKKLIHDGIYGLKNEGLDETVVKIFRVLGIGGHLNFRRWAKTPLYTDAEIAEQRRCKFDREIVFSIITPLYNTPNDLLRDMIESVQAQTYPNWELCLADGSDTEHYYIEQTCKEFASKDSRIKYKKLVKNLGISGNSNACIEMAEGDYISFLDHDDILHPSALYEVMNCICDTGADLIFTDEATFNSPDLGDIVSVHFKPDYAPDTLRANNYICHFTSFKRRLLKECGAIREGFEGAQDHDLFLRLTTAANRVEHIPKVLYYWRAFPGSTAAASDNKPEAGQAGKKAVLSSIESAGMTGTVENAKNIPTIYRIRYDIPSPEPKVNIIISSTAKADNIKRCISSIEEKTTYKNFEIIGGNNDIRESKSRPRQVNAMARAVRDDEYILILDSNVEIISPDWIQEMMMYAQRQDVGLVGAMLYYPNDTVRSAGIVLGLNGIAGHAFENVKRGCNGYAAKLCYAQDVSAVSGVCMLMRKEVFSKVTGMDEDYLAAYDDVDLCLRLREAGYLIVWTPYAELYHHVNRRRPRFGRNEKRQIVRDSERFTSRWQKELNEGDPYYNKNLSLESKKFYEPCLMVKGSR